ncbi:MAG: hypothetical protein GT601_17180, partial [Acidaminobacter sp.]|nr:hypothetical protein [Acidaminobacter sp.]
EPEPIPTPDPEPIPIPDPQPQPEPDQEQETEPLPSYDSDIDDAISTNSNFILTTGSSVKSLPTGLKRNPILWTDGNPNNTIILKMPEAEVDLDAVEGDVVKILSLKYSLNKTSPRFEITASGPFSDVDVQTMDKKLVLDI